MVTMLAEAKGRMLGVGEGSEISCLLILSPSFIRNESGLRLVALPPWSWQATLPSLRSEVMPTDLCSGRASPAVGPPPAPTHREPCPTRAPGWPLHHLSGAVRKILAWPGDQIPQQEPWSSTHESEALREGCSVQPTGHCNCHRETCSLLALVASLLSAPWTAPLQL